jgi:surface antigen
VGVLSIAALTTVSAVIAVSGAVALSSGTGTGCSSSGIDISMVQQITDSIDGFTGDQLVNAAEIMNAATLLKLDGQAQTIGVMAAIAQSNLHNETQGSATTPDGVGVLEEPATWGTDNDRGDITTAATLYFARLQVVPGWEKKSPAEVANVLEPQLDSATYDTDLQAASSLVQGLTNRAGPGACASKTALNDYPWPHANVDELSPLGYVYRNCTDFVAWRLNRDAGITTAPWKYTWGNLTPLGGNAIDWKKSWLANGWATSNTPVPGAVAWWGKDGGAAGHVAYVQAVNLNNTVTLEEYNWGGTNTYDTRNIDSGVPDLYLYPPPR